MRGDVIGKDNPPYPAIWQGTQGSADLRTVPGNQQPSRREVQIECLKLPGAFPDDSILDRIISAAEAGALIAVVMNLVDDAQRLARLLRNKTALDVDVFHARYRFMDRQGERKSGDWKTMVEMHRETVAAFSSPRKSWNKALIWILTVCSRKFARWICCFSDLGACIVTNGLVL